MGMAEQRLLSERKAWRKDHPPDMVAKPSTKSDGSTNVFKWDCRIPGKKGTDWDLAFKVVAVTALVLVVNAEAPISLMMIKAVK